MPLPLFLGIAAAAAAAGGLGTGIHGAVKMKKANDTMRSASEQHKKNIHRFEVKNVLTTECMDMLGKKEIEILSTFEKFSDLIEKIQNRPEFDDIILNGNVIPKYNGEELKKVSIGACALVAGISGAALGTAGGFAAAGATTAAVMALGTASTGTAIASLSGAAATNATLAALGGGALAAGGGGIALGTTMLGVTTAGVGLLVGGIVFSITGSSINNKAKKAYDQMKKAEKQINRICRYLNDLKLTATKYRDTLCTVDVLYRGHLNKLETLVNKENKTNWLTYSDDEKLMVKNTVMLVGLLYKMCNVKLVLASKIPDELNTVNHKEIENIQSSAEKIITHFNGETTQNSEEKSNNLVEDENYYVATIAIVKYFANCDGDISVEEDSILNASVDYISENIILSEAAQNSIDSIVSAQNFSFIYLRQYIDCLDVDKLSTFRDLINEVIGANADVSQAELSAKEKFDSYLSERKR